MGGCRLLSLLGGVGGGIGIFFGAGALGSWLGARLSPPAVLVARGEHARAMRESGLSLAGIESGVVPVTVADACPPLEPDALLLVTVKATDLAAAARAVRDRLCEDTVVAVVANGFAPQEILGAALGRPVVRIVAEFGATLDGPGRVSAWPWAARCCGRSTGSATRARAWSRRRGCW